MEIILVIEAEERTRNMRKILVNKIRCKKCGDIIESKSVHDFKFCKCESVAVDGGHDYLRLLGELEDWEDMSVCETIDEEHGVLEIKDIIKICEGVFEQYDVKYAYLFGSYAKGRATGVSDVDILVSTSVTGIEFFGLVEELRTELHKKVDVLDKNQLKGNLELTEEILKDGIKIYG